MSIAWGTSNTSSSPSVSPEDRIAALDGDWTQFSHAERAAFALARKLTVAPQTVTDADIDAVKKQFTNMQVQEMINLCGRLQRHEPLDGAAAADPAGLPKLPDPDLALGRDPGDQVGPSPEGASGTQCRPAVEPARARVAVPRSRRSSPQCRERTPRFPLVDESAARALLPPDTFPTDQPVPKWARLLANFPKAGPARIAGLRASETKGNMPAKLNAQLAWVSAGPITRGMPSLTPATGFEPWIFPTTPSSRSTRRMRNRRHSLPPSARPSRSRRN